MAIFTTQVAISISLHTVCVIFSFSAPVQHILITDTRNASQIRPDAETPSVLSFIENEVSSLRCIATGGNPPPNMEIYVGGDHVTQQFAFKNNARLHGVKGLKIMSFTTQRWSHNFRPGPEYDGKKLRCSVTVPGRKPSTESVKLSVDCKYNCVSFFYAR